MCNACIWGHAESKSLASIQLNAPRFVLGVGKACHGKIKYLEISQKDHENGWRQTDQENMYMERVPNW